MSNIIDFIKTAVKNKTIEWSRHAQIRMLERDISRDSVYETLLKGHIIEKYSDDKPYPSCLIFNNNKAAPLHVVVAVNKDNLICYIITVYVPTEDEFGINFDRRKTND